MNNNFAPIEPQEIDKEVKKVTLNAKEAAKYLGICYDTLLSAVKKKSIPCFRIGRQYFFKKDTLDEWMSLLEKRSIITELSNENHNEKKPGIRRLK